MILNRGSEMGRGGVSRGGYDPFESDKIGRETKNPGAGARHPGRIAVCGSRSVALWRASHLNHGTSGGKKMIMNKTFQSPRRGAGFPDPAAISPGGKSGFSDAAAAPARQWHRR